MTLTIDLDNRQWDELGTYDTWQRAEIKREKRAASSLAVWTWLAQQSSSRLAPHVYVPWDFTYTRRQKVREVLRDFGYAFHREDFKITVKEPTTPTISGSTAALKIERKRPLQHLAGQWLEVERSRSSKRARAVANNLDTESLSKDAQHRPIGAFKAL